MTKKKEIVLNQTYHCQSLLDRKMGSRLLRTHVQAVSCHQRALDTVGMFLGGHPNLSDFVHRLRDHIFKGAEHDVCLWRTTYDGMWRVWNTTCMWNLSREQQSAHTYAVFCPQCGRKILKY